MEDHSIYIGNKPFMNYVTGVVMQFTRQSAGSVLIKARGKFISRAVDVAEVTRKRFLQNQIDIKDIDIDSEEFTNDEGRNIRVSSIKIILERLPGANFEDPEPKPVPTPPSPDPEPGPEPAPNPVPEPAPEPQPEPPVPPEPQPAPFPPTPGTTPVSKE